MSKKPILFLVLGAFLVFGVAFAAAQGVAEKKDVGLNADTAVAAQGNVTYGSCVSDAAKVKNDCYASVKTQRASCVNGTEDKTVAKQCVKDYTSGKKLCKVDFKKAKKDSCGKIKAGFLERARYAFK